MATTNAPAVEDLQVYETATTTRPPRIVAIAAILAIVVGAGAFLGGVVGIGYTYQQAAVQDITTPGDAVIAEAPVRGPLTMWAQQDIINEHQLNRTDGLYYAQMDRMVPATDEAGEPVLDEAGEPVMVPNDARMSWITATTLTGVLQMGIMAYALGAFAIVLGVTLVTIGLALRRFGPAAA